MKAKTNSFNYVNISDLHFGVGRLDPRVMYSSLATWLTSQLTKDVDYLFVTGDVYDHQLQADSLASKCAKQLITLMCSLCSKYDITLISLKGTTSHDGKQCENFVHINAGLINPCKLYYWDKVGVHFIDGVSFLAVPDNAANTIAGVQAKVEVALKEANLKQVDVGLTHGLYTSHALAKYSHEAHDVNFYLSVVKTVIFNGHIHTTSRYKHLRTCGSFERFRQGEEEPKGGWVGTVDVTNSKVKETFKPNINAYCFTRINLPEDTTDVSEAFKYVTAKLKEVHLTPISYIAIGTPSTLDIKALIDRLNHQYAGTVIFSAVKPKEKDVQFDTEPFYDAFTAKSIVKKASPITPETIIDLMVDKLNRMEIGNVEAHTGLLKEIIDE